MGHSTAPNETPEFNKYRLREPLSDSFLGTRYRAVSNTAGSARAASAAFGSDVSGLRSSAFALRLLRAPSAALIERVAHAAKAVRYVDHPNVLAPIQLIRAQTRLGVITQDVDGFTLNEVMRLAGSRGEALPQSVALRIALDVLEGTGALQATESAATRFTYACGGLTPDSVQVGKDGRARLMDPGVAGAAAGVAYWGHNPVALAYTAPEQSGAEPSFDSRSDAFSIGVMVWEMLAGRSLFSAPTAAETLENLHKGPIPRVQRQHFVRGEPIAASVAQVVAQVLAREPGQRFDCSALAQHLREAAPAASHIEVAAHCHRLAGTSAGAFENAAQRPRTRGASSVFQLPNGTISSVPPHPLLVRPPAAHAAHDASPPVSATSEPQTARFHTPDFVPAPPLVPPPPAGGPITAFPISDLVRTAPAHRRQYGAIAVAATLLLGLSYLAWNEASSRGSPAAAAARPGVTVTTISTEPPRAPVTAPPLGAAPVPPVGPPENIRATITVIPETGSLSAPEPLPSPPSAAAAAAELAEPLPEQPLAGDAVDEKLQDAAPRRRSKLEKVETRPAASPAITNVPAGTFIPDDL